MQQHSVEPAAPADFAVRIAAFPAERDRVYRFRYESFATEHGRWPNSGLVARRIIRDDADDKVTLCYAEADGRIVATLRLRVGRLPDELRGPFDTDRFALASGPTMALADEILVSRIFRKASLLEWLIAAASGRCEESGRLLLFCHARPARPLSRGPGRPAGEPRGGASSSMGVRGGRLNGKGRERRSRPFPVSESKDRQFPANWTPSKTIVGTRMGE